MNPKGGSRGIDDTRYQRTQKLPKRISWGLLLQSRKRGYRRKLNKRNKCKSDLPNKQIHKGRSRRHL